MGTVAAIPTAFLQAFPVTLQGLQFISEDFLGLINSDDLIEVIALLLELSVAGGCKCFFLSGLGPLFLPQIHIGLHSFPKQGLLLDVILVGVDILL